MNNQISFFVPGLPKTKGSTIPGQNKKTGKLFTRNACGEAKNWQAVVSFCALRNKPEVPFAGPVQVDLTFLMPFPQAVLKKPPGTFLPAKRPDIDKLTRCAYDGLTGVIFNDDNQIVAGEPRELYADPRQGLSPGVRIVAKPLDPVQYIAEMADEIAEIAAEIKQTALTEGQ